MTTQAGAKQEQGGLQRLLSIVGALAFVGGFVIAIVAGIWYPSQAGLSAALVIIGLMVGLFNVTGKEILPYLVAATALVVVGQGQVFGPLNEALSGLGDTLNDIVLMLAIFTAPAAVVNALKAAIVLTRPGEA